MIHRIEMVEIEREKVVSRIGDLKPETCPSCYNSILYPKNEEWIALNSLSRKDNDTYICNLCGDREAFNDCR